MGNIEGLDGNGQLFLVLQDLNMDGFIRCLDRALSNDKLAKDQKRQRILIIFSDEEWDVKNLENPSDPEKPPKIQSLRSTTKTTKRSPALSDPTETLIKMRTLSRTSYVTDKQANDTTRFTQTLSRTK